MSQREEEISDLGVFFQKKIVALAWHGKMERLYLNHGQSKSRKTQLDHVEGKGQGHLSGENRSLPVAQYGV